MKPNDIIQHFREPSTAGEVADRIGVPVKKIRTTLTNRMRIGEVSVDGVAMYKGRSSYIWKLNPVRVKTSNKPTNIVRRLISLTDEEWKKLKDDPDERGYSNAIRKLIRK